LEYYCANNTIVDNDINGNTAYGIDLWQFCSNNLITNNDISGNGRGINVQELSNMNTMEYNRLEKNGFGIYLIDNCDDNDLINNTIFDSTANGIYLVTNCELNLIVRNYLVTNGWNGIELDSCDYNTLADNIINANGENGIELAQLCDFNNIKNNTLRSNGDAYPEGGIIAWNNCHNNNFTLNVIESNWYIGIHIGLSDGNLFNNNTIKNHEVGLRFYSSCDSNVIVNNSISQCSGANPVGLVIEFNCIDNIIQNNFINETFTGILINNNADNTDITENIITNCDTRGILIQIDTCDNSEIWQNRFFNNVGENARDDSGTGDTSWDKGGIGNYWDDYGGVDANDNGIGDTPYDISGTGGNQDNFPIWDDGDDLYPTIIRNSPSPPFTFGANAPTFNLTIYDLNLHMAWYKLNNTYTHFFTPVNGINIIQINQTSWDALAEGNFSIGFFVNDTSGNLLTMGMTVTKELPPDEPPSTTEIPFGNYFIVYGIIAIVTVVILKKRKINLK
jgi:parallel beta-helix repeat protein